MDETQLRFKVAQCCRMLEYVGLIDFSGHVSARIPGTDQLFINSWGASRCTITPDDIVRVDLDGNVLEGRGAVPSETPIHLSIYRKRPDVFSVAHLHPPVTTALFIARKEFIPVIYHGSIFARGVPVYDDSRHVNSNERAERLAELLGDARVVIIRGHGCAIATESVESCFFASIYLEDNAEKLSLAYQLGTPKGLTAEEIEAGYSGIWKDRQFQKVWDYFQIKAGVNFNK